MTYDLLVIGGGYWGAGIVFEAKEKSWNVLCLDDADPRAGSRNASAVCDPSAYTSKLFSKYLPGDWNGSDLQDSFSWLMNRGAVKVKEQFWNLPAGTKLRPGAEAIYLSSNRLITDLARSGAGLLNEKVVGIYYDRRFWDVVCRSGQRYRAKRIAVAAGYRTDQVLFLVHGPSGAPRLGVEWLQGRGILVYGTPSVETPVSVLIRPYTKHTVRSWRESGPNAYRVGDTAEKERSKEPDLLKVVDAVIPNGRIAATFLGHRPVMPEFTVEKVAPNLVAATGGHRVGLGLTGLVARKALAAFR